ncbi:MAG: phage portal protein [Alphaproteobacteria bacterium]
MSGLKARLGALFARRRKASAAGPLIAFGQVGRPVWTPRRYDAFAEEGFRKNVVAYRAITEVAQGAASVPWLLFRGRGAEREGLDDHPLLRLLVRPNPLQGGAEMFEALYAYKLIAGNSYVEAVGPDGKPPREFYTLRPDRMKVVPGPNGLPTVYEYGVGGRTRRWAVDPVTGRSPILHIKAFNPLDDWYGMSAIEAAAFAIDQHNAAGAWNQALLQNGARPSGAFVYRPPDAAGALTDRQYERLKLDIEAHYTGPRNAGRPLVLEGGLDWREMSLTPKDMDFINAKHTSARDVALAFGVPPQLLGIPGDNTYSNYREARLALWEETILPLIDHVRKELNVWLVPMFDERLELTFDADAISALSLRRERVWERVRKADFLTINEKREAVGYEPIEGGNVLPAPRRRPRLEQVGRPPGEVKAVPSSEAGEGFGPEEG